MKKLPVVMFVVIVTLLAGPMSAPSIALQSDNPTPYYGPDREVLHARSYRTQREAAMVQDYGPDVEVLRARAYRIQREIAALQYYGEDTAVLLARHWRARQALQQAEAVADTGLEIDMAVVHARRYRLLQAAEAVKLAEVNSR